MKLLKLLKKEPMSFVIMLTLLFAILGCEMPKQNLEVPKVNPIFDIANGDEIADEMNAWADHYCDGAPECYPGSKGGENPPLEKPLHFGENLIEKIKYRFHPYDKKLPTITGNLLTYHAPDQEPIVRYLWEISHDKDFVLTCKIENGIFDPTRQSNYIFANGQREDSWGLCQLNRKWNRNIIEDERFFTDWKWQARQCWRKFQENPHQFMGYKKRYKALKFFNEENMF